MPSLAVLGNAPVSLLAKSGRQVGIPLSLLTLKDGAIDTSRLPSSITGAFDGTALATALGVLVQSGAIRAAPVSAPVVALSVTAKAKGALGNAIALNFTHVEPDHADAGDSKVTADIAYKDRRTKLTQDSIGTQLGTPDGATAPGLVTLKAAAAALPDNMLATKLGGATPLSLVVPAQGGGDAFTIKAVGTDPLFEFLTIAIEDAAPGKTTFTLIVELNHEEGPVKLSELASKFGLLVDIKPGAGGYAAPAVKAVHLSGGGDAVPGTATAAHADILSD